MSGKEKDWIPDKSIREWQGRGNLESYARGCSPAANSVMSGEEKDEIVDQLFGLCDGIPRLWDFIAIDLKRPIEFGLCGCERRHWHVSSQRGATELFWLRQVVPRYRRRCNQPAVTNCSLVRNCCLLEFVTRAQLLQWQNRIVSPARPLWKEGRELKRKGEDAGMYP